MFRKCLLSPATKTEAKGLILSFWAEWEDKFQDDEIRVVYRKVAPNIPMPGYLYVYLNRPAQKIIGRAPLERIEKRPLTDCLALAPQSGYRDQDIRAYAGRHSVSGLYVYTLGQFQSASSPMSVKELASEFNFVPTPQAVLLSHQGMCQLDENLGFGDKV